MMNKIVGFLSYEEVRLCESGVYHRYNLYLGNKDIKYDSHDELYIPPAMCATTLIMLLIYDFELTLDLPSKSRPAKVIYTDFYFKALSKGIINS